MASTAQAMRASLFANATGKRRCGGRALSVVRATPPGPPDCLLLSPAAPRGRTAHEQLPRIKWLPRLLMPSSFCLPPVECFSRHQTEPGGEFPTLAERRPVADGRDQRRRRHRPDAGDRVQAPARFQLSSAQLTGSAPRPLPRARGQLVQFQLQLRQQQVQRGRQAIPSRVFHDSEARRPPDVAAPWVPSYRVRATDGEQTWLMTALKWRITQRSRTRCSDYRSS